MPDRKIAMCRTLPSLLALLLAGALAAPLVAWAADEGAPTATPTPTPIPPATPAPTLVKGSYRVGPGDVLRVVVWKNADLTGEYLVRPDGILTMPLVGDVLAGDATTDAISMQVERKLKYFIESPIVTVIVSQTGSSQMYILGSVARPGAYPLHAPLTILQALAVAGGFTPYADRNGIVLLRQEGGKQTRTRVRYDDLTTAAGKGETIILDRGDTLIVP